MCKEDIVFTIEDFMSSKYSDTEDIITLRNFLYKNAKTLRFVTRRADNRPIAVYNLVDTLKRTRRYRGRNLRRRYTKVASLLPRLIKFLEESANG